MSEQLKHIFDKSACLSKRQLKDYVTGTMSGEEAYAVEHHINSCFFCSEAMDGLTRQKESVMNLDELNANFLKDHLSLISPQIHLNSIAPAVPAQPLQRSGRSRGKMPPLLKPTSILAALLLGFGVLWYLDFRKNGFKNSKPPISAAGTAVAASEEALTGDSPEDGVTSVPEKEQHTVLPDEAKPEQPQKLQASVSADVKVQQRQSVSAATEATDHAGKPVAIQPAVVVSEQKSKTENPENNDKAVTESSMETADAAFDAGKYTRALAVYKAKMDTRGDRSGQYAALQAARCYLYLGNKEAAQNILSALQENGSGPSRRQAKRLLRDMGRYAD